MSALTSKTNSYVEINKLPVIEELRLGHTDFTHFFNDFVSTII